MLKLLKSMNMTTEKILITGITGQDGIFLSEALLKSSKNIEIIGTSRSSNNTLFYERLKQLLPLDDVTKIKIVNINLIDELEVKNFLEINKFNKIIHLSGPSSVYSSYLDPIKYKDLIIKQFDNLIGACINSHIYPIFFQASSSEMFSSHAELPLNEKSKMLPRSPYAKAKFEIHYKIQDLKNSHNWNIKSGIMFNHESEFRPNEFLIMKIISTAISIQSGSREKLSLGSLEYSRDWTYAKDMARAIEKISNESEPIDYVIGSGISHSILDIVNIVFEFFDLEYKQYLEIDSALLRKGDPVHIKSDPKLILKRLSWKANYSINEIIEQMIFLRLKLTNN